MQSFVVFAAVLAFASATPQFLGHPGYYNGFYNGYNAFGYSGLGHLGYSAVAAPAVTYAAPTVVAGALKTQYHAQDELGQSSHGYAYPGQAAAETRDAAGNVRGSYSYVDPNGKVVQTNYIADAVNGFRVESNALPVGPVAGPVHVAALPSPVQDTPEVQVAKAAHFAAVAEAQARSGRKRRGVAYTTGYPFAQGYSALASPLAYHTAAHPVTYAAPALNYGYSGLGHLGYSGLGHLGYSGLGYSGLGYSAVAAPAFRNAVQTTIVNNPGHAVSYRVD